MIHNKLKTTQDVKIDNLKTSLKFLSRNFLQMISLSNNYKNIILVWIQNKLYKMKRNHIISKTMKMLNVKTKVK